MVINHKSGTNWTLYNADCIDTLKECADDAIDYSIFSPPFSSLYTYSDSIRDLGNCKSDKEFIKHFSFLIKELYRVLKPGRNVSIHCMNIPSMKERDGVIGVKDFRGDIIRAFQKEKFIYHSEVMIWKDPLIEAVRTKSIGLMHKQLVKDSIMCRQGLPDYVVTMRKPGENKKPIIHKDGLYDYAGSDKVKKGVLSHNIWRKYASPVWMDIRQSNTLNFVNARDNKDERHICPLQLDVIERCLTLWTNPKDIILSPFAGIGSEGYVSLKMNRKFIGIELKENYYKCAIKNLKKAEKLSLKKGLL